MTELGGQRILIVEDEMLLAMDLEEALQGWGADILGPAPNIDKALAVISEESPDAATLDMNLSGATSLPVAAELNARRIPFVVVSGYSRTEAEGDEFRGARFVKKPYSDHELLNALKTVLS